MIKGKKNLVHTDDITTTLNINYRCHLIINSSSFISLPYSFPFFLSYSRVVIGGRRRERERKDEVAQPEGGRIVSFRPADRNIIGIGRMGTGKD